MASIPNNIVAKDSGGNIKKIDLTELLAQYVKIDDVDSILSSTWPACLKDVDLSLTGARDDRSLLGAPFVVDAINLTTASYGSSDIIYTTQFPVERKTIVYSTDAYKISIDGTGTPFGVCSNKKCFLVLSIDGYERIGSSDSYDEETCRASGAHGGNPIVLDWNKVVLGEGGVFTFSYNDPTQSVGIFGTLNLSRRVSYTGNVHNYDFNLEFVVCGQDAWKNFNEAYKLILKKTDTANAVASKSIDLTPVAYPKISSIGIEGVEDSEGLVNLSRSIPTSLKFKADGGIDLSIDSADESNMSVDEKVVSISVNLNDIAGSGLETTGGKLSVPVFSPAQGTENAEAGLVPSALATQYDSILTASGWRTFEEIGLNSALKPFVGATSQEDGDMGFVPKPLIADQDKFLRGDGTWTSAMASLSGEFLCSMSLVDQNLGFGICLCDADGEWMFQPRQISLSIHPDGSEEGSIDVEVPAEEVYGISLSSPWQAEPPMSTGNNSSGWVADKTFWSESKSGVFSAIFPDGSSADAWIESVQDANNPDISRTRVHYRGNGFKKAHARPFLLSIDGVETPQTCTLAEGESQDFAIAGTEVKVWPASTKTRILSDWRDTGHAEDEEETEAPSAAVPWGGYTWVDAERKAMLENGHLVYIGDAEHTIEAVVTYAVHPNGEPTLVYGLEPSGMFWDIILQFEIEYSEEIIPAGTVVGHVWNDNGAVTAASELFANWSVQPVLQETNEPISIPSSGNGQDSSSEPVEEWIVLNSNPVYIFSLGLELSRTEDGIRAYAPAVDTTTWPKKADSLDLILDYGFDEADIELGCLSAWLNGRFDGFDKSIAELKSAVQLSKTVFTGATPYSNGLPGLVPEATMDDKNKVLMGDGTWSDIVSRTFIGATSTTNGQQGLVPAPLAEDADKYLCGDGTWADPVQKFNAVSGISQAVSTISGTHDSEYDFFAALPAVNQLLASNPDSKIYVSIPTLETSLEPLQGRGISIRKTAGENDADCLEYVEYVNGEAVNTTVQAVEYDAVDPDAPQTFSFAISGSDLIVTGTGVLDESTIQLTGMNGVSTTPVNVFNGLNIAYKHTVDGTETQDFIDLRYTGATSSSSSTPGLVPFAEASQKDMFLRADGTWNPVAVDVQLSIETVEPELGPSSPYTAEANSTGNALNISGSVTVDGHPLLGTLDGSTGTVLPESIQQNASQAEAFVIDDSADSLMSSQYAPVEIVYVVSSEGNAESSITYALNATMSELLAAGSQGLPMTEDCTSAETDMICLASEGRHLYISCTDNEDGTYTFLPSVIDDPEEEAETNANLIMVNSNGTTSSVDLNRLVESIGGKIVEVQENESTSRVLRLGLSSSPDIPLDAMTYVGATDLSNGLAGFVPAAASSQREDFLRGDGTWAQVQIAKEVAILDTDPDSENTSALDNESLIFVEEESFDPNSYESIDISITGNAGSADRVNHSLSISVGGGSLENSSLYTFNGSAAKSVNFAAGTGISLTGSSGTVTVSANSFVGATASAAGSTGIVPAPASADRGRYLKGDGTWSPAYVVTNTMPTSSDNGDIFFYIED